MQLSPLRALISAIAITATISGCATPIPRVARGESMTTGNATYDEFFTSVQKVRSEALAAATEEDTTHAGLVKALGLEPKTTRELAVDETGLRSKRFVEKGVLLHLEIAPEARMLSVRGKTDLGPDGEGLIRSMQDAAKGALEMRRRFAIVASHAADLEKKRVDLRGQAPATFRDDPQAKRDEIIAELDAARAVLTEAQEKANASAGSAARFVVELAQAVETGAADAIVNPKPTKGKKPFAVAQRPQPVAPSPAVVAAQVAPPPKPAAAVAKPAAAPAKPAAAPAKPAKKKPKGGDDFEP